MGFDRLFNFPLSIPAFGVFPFIGQRLAFGQRDLHFGITVFQNQLHRNDRVSLQLDLLLQTANFLN